LGATWVARRGSVGSALVDRRRRGRVSSTHPPPIASRPVSSTSVTTWLERLQADDPRAAQVLWERFAERMLQAPRHLSGVIRQADMQSKLSCRRGTRALNPEKAEGAMWCQYDFFGNCRRCDQPPEPARSVQIRGSVGRGGQNARADVLAV